MTRYFGTDGIRGKAELFGKEFLRKIIFGLEVKGKKVLIGGDTRESTERILKDLGELLGAAGAERVATVGVFPTPAINYVFYELGFDYAIDVTASHNPYIDNGIKIFERGEKFGVKLSEEKKEKIEKALNGEDLKEVEVLSREAEGIYLQHLREKVAGADFSGLRVGLDLANGATSITAEEIFKERGATVFTINENSNFGKEINHEAGSTHIEGLRQLVLEEKLDFGAAFDGDGDRVLFVDRDGEVVDGDEVLVILAEEFGLEKIAATIMANQGLLEYGKENGVEIFTTDVGDQNVFREMCAKDIKIGGEQSGHVILPDEAMGDGVLVALTITKVIAETGERLDQLKKKMKKFPQEMINIDASDEEKRKLKTSAEIRNLIENFEKKLEEETRGRILVRPSGTEELIRITLWGEAQEKIKEIGTEFSKKLKEELENDKN